MAKFKPGDKVRVSPGSGTLSGKTGAVVQPREVKTDGRGIPTNIKGAYSPVDWKKEVAVRLDDGSLITMFKNRLVKESRENLFHSVSPLLDEAISILERRDEVHITLGQLPKSLKDFVRKHAKKRKGSVVFLDTIRVPPRNHAPEFDEFDYNFYILRDLRRGSEVDLQAGLEPFSRDYKTVRLESSAAILWGHKLHGYWTLYLHPDMKEEIA